jgi:hypothetical protein
MLAVAGSREQVVQVEVEIILKAGQALRFHHAVQLKSGQ